MANLEAPILAQLGEIVTSLNEYIDVMRSCDLHDTAYLLSVCKLDLQMRIHEISDDELRAFCDALEEAISSQATGVVIDLQPRARHR